MTHLDAFVDVDQTALADIRREADDADGDALRRLSVCNALRRRSNAGAVPEARFVR